MTKKVGRPSKYDPKYIGVVDQYLKEAIPENMDIPTVEGLALRIDVSKPALYRWAKKHKEFRYALRKLKMTQYQHLLKTGIFGGKKINATIIKLALSHNHGMKERTDQTTDGKPLPTPIYGGRSTK